MLTTCYRRLSRRWSLAALVLALVVAVVGTAILPQHSRDTASTAPTRTIHRLGNLPVSFAANVGQAAPDVRYVAHTANATLLFSQSEVAILPNPARTARLCKVNPNCDGQQEQDTQRPPVTLTYVDANPNTHIEHGSLLPGKDNYISGDNSDSWHTSLSTFSAITYKSLYPGIDVAFTGKGGLIYASYTVAPGADPALIRHKTTEQPAFRESAPVAWQDSGLFPQFVLMGYVALPDGSVQLKTGGYDKNKTLYVASTLIYSTYLGGAAEDSGTLIAVSGDGSAYITGGTRSNNYPLLNPAQPYYGNDGDVFVSKINLAGTALVYSTYLGGNGHDEAWGIVVDSADNCYVAGITVSTDFPRVSPYQPIIHGGKDAFLTRLSPSGSSLIYSTYLGGSEDDQAWALAVNGSNAYVAGSTKSDDFPTLNPLQASNMGEDDIYVTRFNSAGTGLVYSTYLGGPDDDTALGIATDSAGNAYITGSSSSFDFPFTTAGYQPYRREGTDVMEAKISADGLTLVYATFLGGNGDDISFAIAVTPSGEAIITGFTDSTDFPVRHAVQPRKAPLIDAFITKFSSTGGWLVYSTYLGGDGSFDAGYGLALDPQGNAISSGITDSTDFPTVNPIQANNAGDIDAYLSEVGPNGQPLLFSTYMGGSRLDFAWGVAADAQGDIYTTGGSRSSDFLTYNPLQPQNAGEGDNIIVKIAPASGLTPTPPACSVAFIDVPPGSTFYPYVHCLACDGVISGYDDNTYRPGNNVTRGQLSKIVSNAVAYNDPIPDQIFEDVPLGSPFADYVGRLAYRGSIAGYLCGRPGEPCVLPYNRSYFEPNSFVTRGQAAKIVAFTAAYNQPNPGAQTFEDVAPYSTFHTWIEEMASRSLINGYPCGGPSEPCVAPTNRPYFRPSLNVTRGQAAKIVGNTFSRECVQP